MVVAAAGCFNNDEFIGGGGGGGRFENEGDDTDDASKEVFWIPVVLGLAFVVNVPALAAGDMLDVGLEADDAKEDAADDDDEERPIWVSGGGEPETVVEVARGVECVEVEVKVGEEVD
jgi:hypothetical protein